VVSNGLTACPAVCGAGSQTGVSESGEEVNLRNGQSFTIDIDLSNRETVISNV